MSSHFHPLIAPAGAQAASKQPDTRRILIVDDDRDIRSVLVDCLSDQDYKIETAPDGTQALDMIASQTPDLMLLDVHLPGYSGLEVLQIVRADYSSSDLPIIMLSVESEIQTIVSALRLGANDYIQKPTSLEILTARVMTQLELKRLHELNRQHIRQLEALDAMKEKFLQIAAHDLKNPLNVLNIGLEILSDPNSRDPDDPGNRNVLASMRQASQTMESIIDDFLELRAMQEGKIALEVQPLSLTDLVWQSMAQFEAYAEGKQVTLCTELDWNLPTVTADPNRLAQVLTNLISNAIKFSPKGASVIVRAQRSGGCLRIEVEDNGPGIPAGEIPILFQEFTRLSNRPTGKEHSSGVGLAIARHIVELHRGQIGVDSEVGQGSTFWFELPLP